MSKHRLKNHPRGRAVIGALIAVLIVVVILLAAYFAVSSGKRAEEAKAREKAEYKGMVNDLESFTEQVKGIEAGNAVEVPEDRDAQVGSTVAEKTREAMNANMRNQMTVGIAYRQEQEKAGLSKLVDATRIAKDEDFKESLAMVKAVRAVAEDYRAKSFVVLESGPQLIRDQKYGPVGEPKMIRAIESAMASSRPTLTQIWDLEMKGIGLMEELIVFLDSKKGSWKVTEGRFVFDKDEDGNRFGKYVADINEVGKRQQEIQQAAIGRSKSAVDELKAETRD